LQLELQLGSCEQIGQWLSLGGGIRPGCVVLLATELKTRRDEIGEAGGRVLTPAQVKLQFTCEVLDFEWPAWPLQE
jgi:hypothetical protein